jgi:hypothetical protein
MLGFHNPSAHQPISVLILRRSTDCIQNPSSLALPARLTSAAQAQTGLKGGFNGTTFSGIGSKASECKAGFAADGLVNLRFYR